jgi:hypothetical protein
MRRADKEIVSDYNPDSSYEFDFGSDPDEPESDNSTTEQPLLGPATGLVITSTPAGRFVYWLDRRELTLRRLPRLASLPGGNTTSSSGGA